MRNASPLATAAGLLALGLVPGAPAAASPRPATIATVAIANFAFTPARVTIHRGDRVAFVNRDDDVHTATAVDKSFDSAALETGQRWEHRFTRPGTYRYLCALHPYMRATIVVLPAPVAAAALRDRR